MAVLVRELLQEPSLQLRPLTTHEHADSREVTWVATTELTDPTPFLRGGELVCTTALQERTDDQWRALVEQLVAVPVAALCLGTGLVRQGAPDALVEAAQDAGLILLNSPVSVPFIQISRWVADRIFADRYDVIRSSALAQDELLRELLDGRTLPQLLRTLARHLGPDADVVLVNSDNRVIARHPSGAIPSGGSPGGASRSPTVPAPAAARPSVAARADHETAVVPILVDGEPLAYLSCGSATPRLDIVSFAASILGLEIAHRHALLADRRALAGQVLEDVVQRRGPEADARRRLSELGLTCAEPHQVIVGRSEHAALNLKRHPTAILRLFDSIQEAHLTATMNHDVVIVTSGVGNASSVARRLLTRLRDRDLDAAVAIGSAHPEVGGIRNSYLEALQGLGRGPGLHECGELSVTDVLLSSAGAGIENVAESLLRPLAEHDREHRSALVPTLRVWLDSNCSAATTCEALHLHRNSLRYRLGQISRLTSKDLSSLQDRFELWFALQHAGVEPPNEAP